MALIMIGNVMNMITKMSLIAETSVIDDRLARKIFVNAKRDFLNYSKSLFSNPK